MRTITIYDLNLILQLVIFMLFLAGVYFMKTRRKNLRMHRQLMGAAVILNGLLIILIMGRSFLAYLGLLTTRFYEFGPLITWIHATLGGCAEILGVSFLIKHGPNVRFRMRLAAILWTIALLLGLGFYWYYYLR